MAESAVGLIFDIYSMDAHPLSYVDREGHEQRLLEMQAPGGGASGSPIGFDRAVTFGFGEDLRHGDGSYYSIRDGV